MLRQIRYALIVAALALLASLIFVKLPLGVSQRENASIARSTPAVSTSPTIQVGSTTIAVSLADTPDERARGLSGRGGLSEGEGMLFIFDEDDRHTFWMKDMRFPIDIVWISHDGEIIDIKEYVAPETYPAAFSPRYMARYVVELPAGWIERHGVEIGDIVLL